MKSVPLAEVFNDPYSLGGRRGNVRETDLERSPGKWSFPPKNPGEEGILAPEIVNRVRFWLVLGWLDLAEMDFKKKHILGT